MGVPHSSFLTLHRLPSTLWPVAQESTGDGSRHMQPCNEMGRPFKKVLTSQLAFGVAFERNHRPQLKKAEYGEERKKKTFLNESLIEKQPEHKLLMC